MAVTSAAITACSLPQFVVITPRASLQSRCSGNKRTLLIAANHSITKFASWTGRSLPRRLFLFMGFIPVLSNGNPVSGAPVPQMEEPEIIRSRKLPGGVIIQDVVDGDGQTANEGDIVVFNYVCRRSNGYFVYSTVDQFTGEAMPVTLPLDEKQIIKGLKDVLVGMRIGGKRRALIPAAMGYVYENLKPTPKEFGPRRSLLAHKNEPLVFEVQLLKIV